VSSNLKMINNRVVINAGFFWMIINTELFVYHILTSHFSYKIQCHEKYVTFFLFFSVMPYVIVNYTR
jgi:hypothetical protein